MKQLFVVVFVGTLLSSCVSGDLRTHYEDRIILSIHGFIASPFEKPMWSPIEPAIHGAFSEDQKKAFELVSHFKEEYRFSDGYYSMGPGTSNAWCKAQILTLRNWRFVGKASLNINWAKNEIVFERSLSPKDERHRKVTDAILSELVERLRKAFGESQVRIDSISRTY